MRNPLLTAGVLASLFIPSARAQTGVGDEAPDTRFDATFNLNLAGARSLKALRGSAVMIEFWATW